jgi:protocatechuate 3,4-dioxygenase, alpha subunit
VKRGCTPSQTVGPFFSIGMDWLQRADMSVGGSEAERVTVRGRVLDGDANPVADALLEIWQPDESGTFSVGKAFLGKRDEAGFFGFGRIPTNENGEFSFTTIKPGAVGGPDGKIQAPHLAVLIFMRGLLKHLVTRIYFPDEGKNEKDELLRLVPAERRATLFARVDGREPNNLVWDVYLQGERETVFLEC